MRRLWRFCALSHAVQEILAGGLGTIIERVVPQMIMAPLRPFASPHRQIIISPKEIDLASARSFFALANKDSAEAPNPAVLGAARPYQ
jgi:hypothetical protein